MVRKAHRCVTDLCREHFNEECSDRSVDHRYVQDQEENKPNEFPINWFCQMFLAGKQMTSWFRKRRSRNNSIRVLCLFCYSACIVLEYFGRDKRVAFFFIH